MDRLSMGITLALMLVVHAACSGNGGHKGGTDIAPEDGLADRVAPSEVHIAPSDVRGDETLAELPSSDGGAPPPIDCAEAPGAFGCHCVTNADCQSNWCIFHKGEKVCSSICVEECASGFECAYWEGSGADPVFLCRSLFPSLCLPCDHSADCPSAGDRCLVDPDGQGAFCGAPCEADSDCLEAGEYRCVERASTEGDLVSQCVPADGLCSCTDYATAQSLGTPCFEANDHGRCGGWRSCSSGSLSACDAPTPGIEVCGNDIDEDCDTILDDADVCVICSCEAKECGGDGCGESCGQCPVNHVCQLDGTCVCVPNCQDKECGDDGCGTACGTCAPCTLCAFGVCEDGCEDDAGCPPLKECIAGFCQPDVPDLVHLQLPVAVDTVPDEPTPDLNVRILEAGVTEADGAGVGLSVQIGYGDPAFDPSVNPQEWLWTDAAYGAEQGNQGELWTAKLTASQSGSYRYTFRASLDGTHWVYADASGSDDGYQVDKLGAWSVAFSPDILAIEPSHGSLLGGTTVTLLGEHFEPGLALQVDGQDVPASVIDSQTVTFIAPGHDAGLVSVTVENPSGLGATAAKGYHFVPRMTPAVDGDLQDWPEEFRIGTNDIESNWDPALNHLESLFAAFDDQYLYLAVAGVCEANNYIVGYLDLDFGADSGVSDMLALSDNGGDGDLDDALSNVLHVDVAGFGADHAWGSRGMASFQQGDGLENSKFVGWRQLGLPYDLAWVQGAVHCSAGGCEAAIPLATLYGDKLPTALTAVALFARVTDRYGDLGGVCNQALPGFFTPDDAPAVGAVSLFDLWL